MKIARHFDAAAQAWEYDDAELHNIVLLWIFDHRFNLATFDDWIEAPATAPGRRLQLLEMRSQAIEAQRRGDDTAAAGWVQTMRLTQEISARMRVMTPHVERDLAFHKGRKKGTEGPVKELIRLVLPGLERRLQRKASALQAWHACKERSGSTMEFCGSGTRPSDAWHIWIDGQENGVPYARFRKSLSEVRATPRDN